MGQQPGFINANLLKSVLPDNRYQLINVSLWQSYDAWIAATNDPTYANQLSADLSHIKSIQVTRGMRRRLRSISEQDSFLNAPLILPADA